MNNNWQKFLQANKVQLSSEAAADIAKAENAADNLNIICDLSQLSVIVIAGDDAATFMQGQFSNDVEAVNESNSQLSAICNNKGRMIANFRLFKHQENYFLCLKSDLVEATMQHLQKYVLRAHIAIQDVSEQLIAIGISGENAEALLSPLINDLNTEVDQTSFNENYIVIRVPGQQPRYEVFCSFEYATALWQKVATQAETGNSHYWDYLNIQAGLPFIDASTSTAFVPQMANMELINGISFTKGCFTGQEIVARTHYLGKQKRRTYRLRIISQSKPEAGEQLTTNTATENQYIGTLVTVAQVAEDEYEALAVIQIKAADSEELTLKKANAQISLLDLPYSLTDES